VAKCLAKQATGPLGIVSLDAHWDIAPLDDLTMDPRIAGGGCWLHKTMELHDAFAPRNLVEIGPSGMLEDAERVRALLERGTRLYSGWEVKRLGIEAVCAGLDTAYEDTTSVYAHFDMDVIGGAGPAPGDLLGELAEPLGLTEYEVLRLAYEVGARGVQAFSFICIPPGSPAVYRLVVNTVAYLLAGRISGEMQAGG
jgi:agmatinase